MVRTAKDNTDGPNTRKRVRRGTDTEWIDDDTVDKSKPEIIILEIPLKEEKKKGKYAIPLSRDERTFLSKQNSTTHSQLVGLMDELSKIEIESSIPHKFRILQLPISTSVKADIIKKFDMLGESDDSENFKLRNWVDSFMRIPFGKYIPLPTTFENGQQACSDFMMKARSDMDAKIYSMIPAKTQILQLIAQWMVNPASNGMAIGLQGPAGVGKTAFAKYAIADILQRPFAFFAMGGTTEISHYTGHSYTYQGAQYGSIVGSLMQYNCMNPVLYFDEVDKISTTPQGEEVSNMLIHLTDRTQNAEFHDKFFPYVNLDLSRCLIVFSFNDIEKVNPILRDRLTVIRCDGYSEKDKEVILQKYIWKQTLEKLKFLEKDVTLTKNAMTHLIKYSEEKGVRNLIRVVETLLMRLNMLRIGGESLKDYDFYIPVKYPLEIDVEKATILLTGFDKKVEVLSYFT